MATTTNYGWTTPDDTALVKDGAAAIRTLGSSVDTTTKNLNPETTLGDMSFRSSTSNVNTRIPIGSSGQHLTVVAGVPAWATASDQTPLTTKGDLFTFSTLDARLGVGANNTVLTADSAEATGLKWATPTSGGMTLINSGGTALSSNSTTISSIPATYTDLYIVVRGFKPTTDGYNINFRVNADTGTRYRTITISQATGTELTYGQSLIEIGTGTDTAVNTNLVIVRIPDYANTSTWKFFDTDALVAHETNTSNLRYSKTFGAYNQTDAIDSVNFSVASGNFGGGTVYVYGVK